ncbi:S-adenosyl-L-methionine-dependent methyltransferase [Dimargaris cristalligena]|uniref:tRNA (guanine(10)-N(2))-methyltransferase n=1 Tax=Dimargaris cristalligena TaxID=215637 RepID=A0A4Q0A2C7_9FUNG|nr:S-adenosyl-L-methionine-dependent methyltransferase [Dimargaris cristalligena]|eukprot:RKP39330.1 S-adenosyl-L-methionine-dependent methyltransferase [Dimargaris cristalligena]
MPRYLVHFAQFHEDFRLAELEALAQLENIPLKYEPDAYSNDNPFLLVELPSNEDARRLVQRAILVKEICEYWGSGDSYDSLFAHLKTTPERWDDFKTCSFKFLVKAFGGTRTIKEQIKIINTFSFLAFEGPIDLKNPDEVFIVYEDYGNDPILQKALTNPNEIHFGRLIAYSNRDVVQTYNLKKREYLGNTSMDAELSLVMANQALARPGTITYDPFVGTGSFLLTCAHFGAFTMGSDIDGRQIRGARGETDGIKTNIKQYGLDKLILDTLVFDISRNPWRQNNSGGTSTRGGPWFDAIVTDPPYGVRAGAKRLGRKTGLNPELSFVEVEGTVNHLRSDYYPPTVPYEMSEVLTDLLEFAARHLVVGGRLVYWLPTVVDEYSSDDVPLHPCLELKANSEQNFGSWSRRLITMEKSRDWENLTGATIAAAQVSDETAKSTPPVQLGHYNFREKYFSKFDSNSGSSTPNEAVIPAEPTS